MRKYRRILELRINTKRPSLPMEGLFGRIENILVQFNSHSHTKPLGQQTLRNVLTLALFQHRNLTALPGNRRYITGALLGKKISQQGIRSWCSLRDSGAFSSMYAMQWRFFGPSLDLAGAVSVPKDSTQTLDPQSTTSWPIIRQALSKR